MSAIGVLETRYWITPDRRIEVEPDRVFGEYLVCVDGTFMGYATTEALGRMWREMYPEGV